MYEQKEYMEEYLKFKEVIAGMKKWGFAILFMSEYILNIAN